MVKKEYDRLLPLTLSPKPEKLVRTLWVYQPYADPDLTKRVAELVKDLAADDFSKRETAKRQLKALGRAAFGPLQKELKRAEDVEAKDSIRQILKEFDSEQGLNR